MFDSVNLFEDTGIRLLTFNVNGVSNDQLLTKCSQLSTQLFPGTVIGSKVIELTSTELLYVLKLDKLFAFANFGTETQPLLVENFIKQFMQVSALYLGYDQLTPQLVNSNKPTLVLILSEMFSSKIPRITELNIIQQLLPNEDLLTLIAKAGKGVIQPKQRSTSGSLQPQQSSLSALPTELRPWDVPWRKSVVEHSKEQIFIDVVERVNVISKHKQQTYLDISGQLIVKSMLSNLPTVTITLNEYPSLAHTIGLHQSVDLATFGQSNSTRIKFIPPDGTFKLAQYKLNENVPKMTILNAILTKQATHFDLAVSTAINRKVQEVLDLKIKIKFPPNVKSVKELSLSSGDFDTSNNELIFSSPVPTGWNANLRAVGYNKDKRVVHPIYVELQYKIVGMVESGVGVKSVHVDGVSESFKGVRYQMEVTEIVQ